MKLMLLNLKFWFEKVKSLPHSMVGQFLFSVALSWVYAITAQMILPLYPVVITVLPLPLYVMIYSFGSPAAYAFVLYILQGLMGAPFFAHCRSGWYVIAGPSGGYLMGMAIVGIFLAATLNWYKHSWRKACLLFIITEIIVVGVGLLQLSFFVSPQALLMTGLYPFVFGEIVKVVAATLFVAWRAHACSVFYGG